MTVQLSAPDILKDSRSGSTTAKEKAKGAEASSSAPVTNPYGSVGLSDERKLSASPRGTNSAEASRVSLDNKLKTSHISYKTNKTIMRLAKCACTCLIVMLKLPFVHRLAISKHQN